MSAKMTVSEARAALPQLLDRVSAGEEVTVTRHGKLAAVLGAAYRLRAADAIHLAAVGAGADRFLTNNPTFRSQSVGSAFSIQTS